MNRPKSRTAGSTIHRDLRTGRSLWCDSSALGLPVRPLTGPVEVDVAVIGAGISGALVAHELSRDHSVVVLDRRPPLMGSTVASTALLQWELDLPLTALAAKIGPAKARRAYLRSRAGVADLMTLVREEDIRCGLRPKDTLYLAGDAYGMRALAEEAKARAAIGLESDWLTAAQLREGFGPERTGAILSKGSASADPAQLAAGLLRRAAARGAAIHSPVEVTGVLQGDGWVSLVNGAGFEVRARQVVFCCGYEFPKAVPTDGAQVLSTWAFASRRDAVVPHWLNRHLVWEASDPYLYFRTTNDGRLIVGGEDAEGAERHDDPALLKQKAARIAAKLKALVPGIDFELDHVWAGAFGESSTSLPLIGAIPGQPRCHAVMGLGGNGITYSVVASQVIAAAVRGKPDPDADLYRIG